MPLGSGYLQRIVVEGYVLVLADICPCGCQLESPSPCLAHRLQSSLIITAMSPPEVMNPSSWHHFWVTLGNLESAGHVLLLPRFYPESRKQGPLSLPETYWTSTFITPPPSLLFPSPPLSSAQYSRIFASLRETLSLSLFLKPLALTHFGHGLQCSPEGSRLLNTKARKDSYLIFSALTFPSLS